MSGRGNGLDDEESRRVDQQLDPDASQGRQAGRQPETEAPADRLTSSPAESHAPPEQTGTCSKPSTWWQLLTGGLQLTKAAAATGLSLVQKILQHTDYRSIGKTLASHQTAALETDPVPPLLDDEVAEITQDERRAILEDARRMRDVSESNISLEAKSKRMDELQCKIIDRIVTLVMTKCRGLSTPQISEKLEFLREIPGLLQDAYRLQGVSLHNAPLIADLPGVAATLAGIDVTVEISDGTLASVEEYLAASTTVEDLAGRKVLELFRTLGADILSESAEAILLTEPQPAAGSTGSFVDAVLDIINRPASNCVKNLMSKNVATALLGNLPQELQQLTITPIDTTIDVRWRVQHDGHVVDGLKTERFALWTSSNKRLLITLPERGASDARFMEHVQQVAFELARFMLSQVPFSGLEARVLAARLLHAISVHVFERKYPIDVAHEFEKAAMQAEQLAGPPTLIFGFQLYVLRYFSALKQRISKLLPVNTFLTVKPWVACNGGTLDISQFRDVLHAMIYYFTTADELKPLLIEGRLLQLFVRVLWLTGKFTDQVGVSGEWCAYILMIVTMVTLKWSAILVDDAKKLYKPFDIILSSRRWGTFYVEVKGTSFKHENENSHYFFISEQEMERAKQEGRRYVLIRVFDTPVPRRPGSKHDFDLKFLVIRDLVGQLQAGYLLRRDDPTRPGTIRLYVGGGRQRCSPYDDGSRDYVRNRDGRSRRQPFDLGDDERSKKSKRTRR